MKRYLQENVLSAAQHRVSWVFDTFERIYVSFSGGKDSTVLTHIVLEEAIKRDRKVGLMCIDWECQFNLTIQHVTDIFELYKHYIEPYWIAIPITTVNGCSQFEPEWTCWDETKQNLWIRKKPSNSIKKGTKFPFYYDGITFEEFTPKFTEWYSQGKTCCNLIGIRSQESYNRFRAVSKVKENSFDDKTYLTHLSDNCYSAYPLYDWETEDIWTYYAKTGYIYNRVYDRMYKAGLSINQMRIDEPFGCTQRKGLWLYQVIEPNTWKKMVLRVSGANMGSRYCQDIGNILGNNKVKLPPNHTWKSFAGLILETMPDKTKEHYKNKISTYCISWQKRGYPEGIPEEADSKFESLGKAPSWRQIVKTLLKNDYWCIGLGFSPTRTRTFRKCIDHMNLIVPYREYYNETNSNTNIFQFC